MHNKPFYNIVRNTEKKDKYNHQHISKTLLFCNIYHVFMLVLPVLQHQYCNLFVTFIFSAIFTNDWNWFYIVYQRWLLWPARRLLILWQHSITLNSYINTRHLNKHNVYFVNILVLDHWFINHHLLKVQTGIKRLVGDDYVNRSGFLCCSQQSDFSIIEILL